MTLAVILTLIKRYWREIAVGLFIILLLIFVAVMTYRCTRPTPAKLDNAEIIKAETAIKEQNRKEMTEILAASEVRTKELDGNIKAAEEATQQAIKDYSSWSNEELAAELERRK